MFLNHSKTPIVFLMTQTYRLAPRVMQEHILNSLIRLDTYQTLNAEYTHVHIHIYVCTPIHTEARVSSCQIENLTWFN